MGEFTITRVGPRGAQRFKLQNFLHDEGADYILRQVFPVGGSFPARRIDWEVGLGGLSCRNASNTPDGNASPGQLAYDQGTSYAEVTNWTQNEGGAFSVDPTDTSHQTLLGYNRIDTNFGTLFLGRSATIETKSRVFKNNFEWTDLGTWPPGQKPSRQYPWEPWHEYPWTQPIWHHEYFGVLPSILGEWSLRLSGNERRATTMGIGFTFVSSDGPPGILLASASFDGCIVLQPEEEIWVQYTGQVYPGEATPGGWVTADFIDKFTLRGWTDITTVTPSNYRAILLSDPVDSLDWSATLATVTPLPSANGYAPVPITSWAKGTNAYDVVGTCAGWLNNSISTWPTANYFAVIATFNSVDVLCWFEPITPVAAVEDDTITFPSGIKFSLRDSYV